MDNFKKIIFIHSKTPQLEILQKSIQKNITTIITDNPLQPLKELSKVDYEKITLIYDNNQKGFQSIFNNVSLKELVEFLKEFETVKIIDLITCNIDSRFKKEIEEIEEQYSITIRYSLNETGNQNSGGDWILESHNINIKDEYFNENINDFTAVLGSSSTHFSMIVDGEIWSSGDGRSGQMGNGLSEEFNNIFKKANDISNAVFVSCGNRHTIVKTADERIQMQGGNDSGQLGDGTFIDSLIPLSQPPDISNVKTVRCGSQTTFILFNDNTLKGVGSNGFGNLGISSNVPNINIFQDVLISENIDQIDCGDFFTYVLTQNGQIQNWGENTQGQLGINPIITNSLNKPTLMNTLSTNFKVKQISCGQVHVLFLLENGMVKSMGNNSFGQLGIDVCNGFYFEIQDVVDLNSDIQQISTGTNHSLFLDINGRVYSCGDNFFGQLGHNDKIQRNKPTLIESLEDETIVQIRASNSQSAFLTSQNKLQMCGYNVNGQLGQPSWPDVSIPTLINDNPLPENQTIDLIMEFTDILFNYSLKNVSTSKQLENIQYPDHKSSLLETIARSNMDFPFLRICHNDDVKFKPILFSNMFKPQIGAVHTVHQTSGKGLLSLGTEHSFILDRKVDIVESLWLQLPFKSQNVLSLSDFRFPLGINMIDYVETRIGGRPIDKITGESIYNLIQLRVPDDIQVVINGLMDNRFSTTVSQTDIWIPLPLGILYHGSRPFPLCALNQQIEIYLKLNNSQTGLSLTINGARIWTTGWVLPPQARDFIVSQSEIPLILGQFHETQNNFKMISRNNQHQILLNGDGMIQDIYFKFRDAQGNILSQDPYETLQMRIGNEAIQDPLPPSIQRTITPMTLQSRTPDLSEGLNVISFSDEPEGFGLAGWVDLQVNRKLYLTLNLIDNGSYEFPEYIQSVLNVRTAIPSLLKDGELLTGIIE